jgi:hypothetical protein
MRFFRSHPSPEAETLYGHQEQIRKIVLACDGAFEDDLTLDATTHLIADAVGSHKHRVRYLSSSTKSTHTAILMLFCMAFDIDD